MPIKWEDLKIRFTAEQQAIKQSDYSIGHQATELEQRFFTYIFSRLMTNPDLTEIKASDIDLSSSESFSIENSEVENKKTKTSIYIAAVKAFYTKKPFCFSLSRTNFHWVAGAFVPYEKDGGGLGLAEFHIDSMKGIMGLDYLPYHLESVTEKEKTLELLSSYETLEKDFMEDGKFFSDQTKLTRREFLDGLFAIITGGEGAFKEKLEEIRSANISLDDLVAKQWWLDVIRAEIDSKDALTEGDKETYNQHLNEVEEYLWTKIAFLHFTKRPPLITKKIHSSDETMSIVWPRMQREQNCGYCNAYNKALIGNYLSIFGSARTATEGELSLERLKGHADALFMTPSQFNDDKTEIILRDLHKRFAKRLYKAFEKDDQDFNIVLHAINDGHPLGSLGVKGIIPGKTDLDEEPEEENLETAIIRRETGDSRPGYSGTYFQILYLMNQAWDIWTIAKKDAKLETEVPGYVKFDDVVYRDGKTLVVVQTKYNHSEDSSYSFIDWVTPTSHKVSLARYFDSWAFIRNRDLDGVETTSIRYKIVSNYGFSSKTKKDKDFLECFDLDTRKFKPGFLDETLHRGMLDEIIGSFCEHSLTLRRDILLPQLEHVKVSSKDGDDKAYEDLIEYLSSLDDKKLIEISDQSWRYILLPFLEDIGEETKISNHASKFIRLLTEDLAKKTGKTYEECNGKLEAIRFSFTSKEGRKFRTKEFKDSIFKLLAEQESTIKLSTIYEPGSSNEQLIALKFIINKVGNLREFLSDPSFRITVLLGDILSNLTSKDQKLSESEYSKLFFEEFSEEIHFKNDGLRKLCLDHLSTNRCPISLSAASGKGSKKSKVADWRESLYPFLIEDKRKGGWVLNGEFLESKEGTETAKFRDELEKKLKPKKREKKEKTSLQDLIFVGVPADQKKKINKPNKSIKPALKDAEQRKLRETILQYLGEIELDLAHKDISTVEKELKEKFAGKFHTREEVHFRTYIYSMEYWFRVESQKGPVTFEYVDRVFSEKASPEYQRAHLVGLAHSHEDKIISPDIEELRLLSAEPLKRIDDFMASSEQNLLVIKGEPYTGKSELIKLYFRQLNKGSNSPRYLDGEYLFLSAAEFKVDTHIAAVKAHKHIVLILDDADILIAKKEEIEKIIAEVSATKTKLILLSNNTIEIPFTKDSYALLQLEPTDFEKFPDKIKDQVITYNSRKVELKKLPQGIRSLMGYQAILLRVLENKSLDFTIQQSSGGEFYIPQFGKKVLKVFKAEEVLKGSIGASIIIRYKKGCLGILEKKLADSRISCYPEDQKDRESGKRYYINSEKIEALQAPNLATLIIISSDMSGEYQDSAVFEIRKDGNLVLIKGSVNIIDSEKERRDLEDMQDSLLEEISGDSSYRILVEANYGLGKSRLANKLAKSMDCWSLLINVKDLQDVNDDGIADLLLKLSKFDKTSKEGLIRLGIRKGSITVIIDGLDELSPSTQERFKKELDLLFSYSKIIAFSRYEGIRPFTPSATFSLEPFDRKKIASFITSSVENAKSREKALRIAEKSGMFELLKVPLHCQMFCQIANQNPTELQVITRTKLYSLSNILAFRKFLEKEGMQETKSVDDRRVLRRLHDERNFMQLHALRNFGFLINEEKSLEADLRKAIRDEDFARDISAVSLAYFSDSKRSALQFNHQTWQEYYAALGFISFVMSGSDNKRYDIAQEVLGRYLLSPSFMNIWKFVVQICQASVSDCDNLLSIKEFKEMMSIVEELYGGIKVKILDVSEVVSEEMLDKPDTTDSSVVEKVDDEEEKITFEDIIKGIRIAPSNDYWDKPKIDKKREHDEKFGRFTTKLLSLKIDPEQKIALAKALTVEFLGRRKDKTSITVIYNILQIIYFHKLQECDGIGGVIKNFQGTLSATKRKDLWDYSNAQQSLELVQEKDSYTLDWLISGNKYHLITKLMLLGYLQLSELKGIIIGDKRDISSIEWGSQCNYIEMLDIVAQQSDDKDLLRSIIGKLILIINKSGEPSPQSSAIELLFKCSRLKQAKLTEQQLLNLILDAILPEKGPCRVDNYFPKIIAHINEYNLLTEEVIEKLFTIMTGLKKSNYRNALENSLLEFDNLPDRLEPLLFSCIKNTTLLYKYQLIEKFGAIIKTSAHKDEKDEIVSDLSECIRKEKTSYVVKSLAIILNEEEFIKVLAGFTKENIGSMEIVKKVLNIAAESLPPARLVKMLLDIVRDKPDQLEAVNMLVFEFIKKHPVNIGVFKGKLIIADSQKAELLELPTEVIDSLRKTLCLPIDPTPDEAMIAGAVTHVTALEAGRGAVGTGVSFVAAEERRRSADLGVSLAAADAGEGKEDVAASHVSRLMQQKADQSAIRGGLS